MPLLLVVAAIPLVQRIRRRQWVVPHAAVGRRRGCWRGRSLLLLLLLLLLLRLALAAAATLHVQVLQHSTTIPQPS
jgi:hypothetical protein